VSKLQKLDKLTEKVARRIKATGDKDAISDDKRCYLKQLHSIAGLGYTENQAGTKVGNVLTWIYC